MNWPQDSKGEGEVAAENTCDELAPTIFPLERFLKRTIHGMTSIEGLKRGKAGRFMTESCQLFLRGNILNILNA